MKRCKLKTLFNPNKIISSPISNLSFSSKYQEFIHSHKTSLETLLYIIKSAQISILSNSNNKKIKNLLLELKKNLDEIFIQQNLKLTYFQQVIAKKKTKIKKYIFENNQDEFGLDTNYENKNEINYRKLKSEIDLLKLQNFSIEQNIEEIQNKIKKMNKDYNYIKLCIPYNYFDEKENFCCEQKYFPLIIKLLNKQINENKKKLNKIIFAKQDQKEEIELINNYISHLKLYLPKERSEDLKNEIYNEDYRSNNCNNITRYNTYNISSGKKFSEEEKREKLIIFGNTYEINSESDFSEKYSNNSKSFSFSGADSCSFRSQNCDIKINLYKENFLSQDENSIINSEIKKNKNINSSGNPKKEKISKKLSYIPPLPYSFNF